MMYSKNQDRYWNVTFYNYATQKMSNEDILKYGKCCVFTDAKSLQFFVYKKTGKIVCF